MNAAHPQQRGWNLCEKRRMQRKTEMVAAHRELAAPADCVLSDLRDHRIIRIIGRFAGWIVRRFFSRRGIARVGKAAEDSRAKDSREIEKD